MTSVYTDEQLARIKELIEKHTAIKQQRLLERAKTKWRRSEAHRRIADRPDSPERVH